ncbi:hypothetical protein F2Q69_00037300 [Brassica cretica]|uniref:Uncharacterized protein n=1 Tax=Brassica cretica TaxID=69181 RepID=A0A8S9SQC1_BRACR|nr:hypothetical protein F2Q69_00037300 [Brassica cretica]
MPSYTDLDIFAAVNLRTTPRQLLFDEDTCSGGCCLSWLEEVLLSEGWLGDTLAGEAWLGETWLLVEMWLGSESGLVFIWSESGKNCSGGSSSAAVAVKRVVVMAMKNYCGDSNHVKNQDEDAISFAVATVLSWPSKSVGEVEIVVPSLRRPPSFIVTSLRLSSVISAVVTSLRPSFEIVVTIRFTLFFFCSCFISVPKN